MKPFFVLLLFGIGIPLHAQATEPSSNSELKIMIDEDQRIRTGPQLAEVERTRITRTDSDRRAAVKQMIATNQLETGLDYRNAALILQHGSTSDDYLLAHTLAVIAASRGNKDGLWLSSATLDRYLIAIKQSQIFGTQYNHFDPKKPWTQAPYHTDLIPDTLRKQLNVPSRAEQQKQLDHENKPESAK